MSTELSKCIWQLKRSNIKFSITSKVSGNPSSIICPFCITEKLDYKFLNNKDLQNEKSELINKCGHLSKFLLANVKNKGNICSDILFVLYVCGKCQFYLSF